MGFKDWVKEQKKAGVTTPVLPAPKTSASNSTSGNNGNPFRSDINSWLSSEKNIASEYNNLTSTWKDEDDQGYHDYMSHRSDWLAQAQRYRQQYAGNYEAQRVINSAVDRVSKMDTGKARRFFSSVGDEETFNNIKFDTDMSNKYKNLSYDEMMTVANSGKVDAKEADWLKSTAPNYRSAAEWQKDIDTYNSTLREMKTIEAQYKATYKPDYSAKKTRAEREDKSPNAWMKYTDIGNDARYKELGRQLAQYDIDYLKSQKYYAENREKYQQMFLNEDYDELSKYVDEDRTKGFSIQIGDTSYGSQDDTYAYINNINNRRKQYNESDAPLKKYDFMTSDQIADYNYLYNKEGKKSAQEYLDYIGYDLDAKRMQKYQQQMSDFADGNWLKSAGASLASVGTNLMSGIGLLDVAFQNARNDLSGDYRPINYNSLAMNPTVATTSIRGTVAQNITDATGTININEDEHPFLAHVLNGKGLADVYQLGMSMVDSGATALIGKATGIGAFGTLMLGGSAGSQGVITALEQGATDEQALAMGIINGTFESLFEYASLDHLLNGDTTNILKAFLTQGFVEGSEEFNTTLFNTMAEILVMAKNSDYKHKIQEYIDAGVDPEQAETLVIGDIAIGMGWDFIGGAISGGLMEGLKMGADSAYNYFIGEPAAYGQLEKSDVEEIVRKSMEIDPENKLAQEIQSKLEGEQKVSGYQIRNLVNQSEKALGNQDVEAYRKAATERLTALGETENVEAVSDALARQAAGKRLTAADNKLIENSKYGKRLQNELNQENIASQQYDSAWAEKVAKERADARSMTSNAAQQNTELSTQSVQQTAEPKTLEQYSEQYGKQAQAFIHTYEKGQYIPAYAENYAKAYEYGQSGVPKNVVLNYLNIPTLTQTQKEIAYESGVAAAALSAQNKGEKLYGTVNTINGPRVKGRVIGQGVKIDTLKKRFNDQQHRAYRALVRIAEATGINIVLYSSKANAQGKYTVEEGRYEGGNTIYIDINSGVNDIKDASDLGKYTMLRTFGHEFTHFLEKYNSSEYNDFRKLVFDTIQAKLDEQNAKDGTNLTVDDLILKKQSDYQKYVRSDFGYEEASLEVVADAMSDIFRDSNLTKKLYDQNPSLIKKMVDKLRQFLGNIKAYFSKVGTSKEEAQYLMEEVDGSIKYLQSIVDAYDKLALGAVENYQRVATNANAETAESNELVDMADESVAEMRTVVPVETTTQASIRSLAEAGGFYAEQDDNGNIVLRRDGNKVSEVTVDDIENSPIGALVNYCLESNYISETESNQQKKLFADLLTMAAKSNDFAMSMQFAGSAIFTAIKSNSDKQYNTTYDFPSICTKTQAVIDSMSAAMKAKKGGLTKAEIEKIYNEVFHDGNPVPCPECYVFSRWVGIGSLLDNIWTYQNKFDGMTKEEVQAQYLAMEKIITDVAAENNLSFGKAKGKLAAQFTKRFNDLYERVTKAENQGEKVSDKDYTELAILRSNMELVKSMTWIDTVYFKDAAHKSVNPRSKWFVDESTLFDLNDGESFASQYPEAWAFRTTQGAGYGKAITPYSEAVLGEGIYGTNGINKLQKDKKAGTFDNIFLNQRGSLDKDARKKLETATKKMNNQAFLGGQRFQSTSDARFENAFDYLIAALEVQAMHGMVQVYTKVPGAVPTFAAWGFATNQSLMPKGGGLNAKGEPIDTAVGGMNPEVARANRKQFDTQGTITIGVNDNHIRALMHQAWRDFIIPYHASGGDANLIQSFRNTQDSGKVNAVRSTDYTRTQGDKVLSDEVLRNYYHYSQSEIDLIHARRKARLDIFSMNLNGKKAAHPDMDIVRGSRFLSDLYDKLAPGGEWAGVTQPKSIVESQIFPNEFWDESVTYDESGKITQDYLDYCKELGILHRFSGMAPSNGTLTTLSGYDENGNRVKLTDLAHKADGSIEDFFWKTLTDHRMYDNDGNYLPQRRVSLSTMQAEDLKDFAGTKRYGTKAGRQYDPVKSAETARRVASEIQPRGTFSDPSIGENVQYSIRDEDPPEKTLTGYKVFVVKNGKLYPPMVANPNAEDTPVGVWLNADIGQRAPDSKTGRMQVKAGGKGTQGGSGSLAFRPGWHLGEMPLAKQFDRLNPETGVKELFPSDFVWAECDIAADVDYQEEAMSYGYTPSGKFQHSLAGLPKLPVNGYYKYRTNPRPDTVPWLITGAMKVNRVLSDAEVADILRSKGVEPPKRQGGEKTLADLGLERFEQPSKTQYELRSFEDGTRFVDVKVDQKQFDGLSDVEKLRLATKIIKSKYQGKVIGIDNRVFVNGRTATEYGNPVKFLPPESVNAKTRAATELDNLIDAGRNWRTEPDGLDGHFHEDAVGGFDKADTTFKIGNDYYEGVINVINLAKGRRLKDITKIKNITNNIISSYGENPKSYFVRDVSIANVSQPNPSVKPESQMSLRDSEYLALAENPEQNREQLQKMVDDAAKAAGYIKRTYHGTEAENLFSVFNTPAFTTSDRYNAETYAAKGKAKTNVYSLFFNPSGGIEVDCKGDSNRFIDVPDNLKPYFEKSRPWKTTKTASTDELVDAAIDIGYKSITFKNVGDNGYNNWSWDDSGRFPKAILPGNSDVMVAFSANQLKSADPVTYDDAGNVVPLSERFNPENDDIRYQIRSSTLTDRDILRAAADDTKATAKLSEPQKASLFIFKSRLNKLDNASAKRLDLLNQRRKLLNGRKPTELQGVERDNLRKIQNNLNTVNGQIRRYNEDLLKVEHTEVLSQVLKNSRKTVERDANERWKEELREQRDAAVKAVKAEYQQKLKAQRKTATKAKNEAVKENNALWRERNKNKREKMADNADARKYRKRITDSAMELSEWLKVNSDKKHVPEILKAPVAGLLESIDFSSKRFLNGGEPTKADRKFAENLIKIKQLIEGQQGVIDGKETATDNVGAYLDISQENREFLNTIADTIASYGDGIFTLNEMTTEELDSFSDFMKNLTRAIKLANVTLANARYKNIPEMAQNSMKYFESLGNASPLSSRSAAKFLQWTNATPYYAFKRYGEAGEALFDGFTRGWEKLAMNSKEIIDFTEKTYTSKEVREWKRQMHDITLSDGTKITMTTAQIMELSQLYNREQARKHIEAGGIRIANIKLKHGTKQQTDHHHFTAEDLSKVIGLLTPRQIKVAEELRKFMGKRGGEWGNEISMARFGYEFYTEGENYYTIRTDANDRPMKDTDEQSNSMFRLLNLSSSKSLNPNANNALIVSDIFDTFADHMSDMAKLNALGLPLLDAIKWYNYTERIDNDNGTNDREGVKKSMEQAYGTVAGSYFKTLLKDINGVKDSGDRGGNLASRFISNYKIAAVAANLRVALLQPTSYVRAMYILKPKNMIAALSFKNWGRAYKEALQYSGTAVWKNLGYYDTDIARSLKGQIEHDDTWMDVAKEKSMILAEKGDSFTWGRLWVASKLEAKDRNPSLSGEALNKAAADIFREVVYATQVMDSTLTRSEMMRGTTRWTKLATAFMAEPTLSANILMDAASQFENDKRRTNAKEAWSKNKGKIALALTTYVSSAAFAALIESIADAARDDDDYESFLDKLRQAFLGEKGFMTGNLGQDLTILGKIPTVKDIISTIRGDKSSDMSIASVESITNAFSIWKETIGLATGALEKPTSVTWNGKMTRWGKIYKTLQALSQLSGFAVSNLTRDAAAVWNSTVASNNPNMKLKTYNAGVEGGLKSAYKSGSITENEAVSLLLSEGKAKDEDEAYFMIREWEDTKKYDALKSAISAGDMDAFNDALDTLAEHGVSNKTAYTNAKTYIGTLYKGTDSTPASITEEEAVSMLMTYANRSEEEARKEVARWKYSDWSTDDNNLTQADVAEALANGDYTEAEKKEIWNELGYKTDIDEAQSKAKSRIELDENAVVYNSSNWLEGVGDNNLSESDRDALVNAYGGEWFAGPYKGLRYMGYSPSSAYNLLMRIDLDGNKSVKQAEAFAVLKTMSDTEAAKVWDIFGWKTDYYTYKSENS